METDTENQRQLHLDFQLAKEEERSERAGQLELTRAKHKRAMESEKHEQAMSQMQEKRQAELEHQVKMTEAEVS